MQGHQLGNKYFMTTIEDRHASVDLDICLEEKGDEVFLSTVQVIDGIHIFLSIKCREIKKRNRVSCCILMYVPWEWIYC